jgi:hypothetical protein
MVVLASGDWLVEHRLNSIIAGLIRNGKDHAGS